VKGEDMQVTFYGAVRQVTGSMHLISTESDRILLDCGMFQGRRKESAEKNQNLPFDPRMITNLVLSHAHIDHSGRIPLLTKKNFAGRIISTRATADACGYLLPDSASIQESDAEYLNYKTARSALSQMKSDAHHKKTAKEKQSAITRALRTDDHKLNLAKINEIIEKYDLERIRPLYDTDDAQHALTCFDGHPYRSEITVGKDMTATLYEAGHILGSAFSIVKYTNKGRTRTICFTGDIGRFDKPIIKDPTLEFAENDCEVDLMIMESTYGDRLHEPVIDLKPKLKAVLDETTARGGSIVIPSFAYGRTQELLYTLHLLYNEGSVRKLPVYVDSPLATNITEVFGDHPEVYDRETHKQFLQQGENPFSFKQVHFVRSVQESMKLMREEKSHIVISASGMCEAGRILHHLRYKIHNPKNTILIVGFMAEHTLGRRILEQGMAYAQSNRSGQPPLVKFFNKEYPLNAQVVKIGGFSAHGDKNEMMHFLKKSNLNIKKIAVVHGEEEQCLSFSQHLNENGFHSFVPKEGETVSV
jgi:metallo-beta-lactamase family protein